MGWAPLQDVSAIRAQRPCAPAWCQMWAVSGTREAEWNSRPPRPAEVLSVTVAWHQVLQPQLAGLPHESDESVRLLGSPRSECSVARVTYPEHG